jgi:hypothetical protein
MMMEPYRDNKKAKVGVVVEKNSSSMLRPCRKK